MLAHILTHIHTHMYVQMFAYMHTHTRTPAHTHTCLHISSYAHSGTYTQYLHTCIYVNLSLFTISDKNPKQTVPRLLGVMKPPLMCEPIPPEDQGHSPPRTGMQLGRQLKGRSGSVQFRGEGKPRASETMEGGESPGTMALQPHHSGPHTCCWDLIVKQIFMNPANHAKFRNGEAWGGNHFTRGNGVQRTCRTLLRMLTGQVGMPAPPLIQLPAHDQPGRRQGWLRCLGPCEPIGGFWMALQALNCSLAQPQLLGAFGE